jgi:hypothetical protein
VKGFLDRTDSSIKNVLLIAVALGLTLSELERPPENFAELLRTRQAHAPGQPTLTD